MEDDLKNKDNLKNEDFLKNEDDLKNEYLWRFFRFIDYKFTVKSINQQL